MPSMAPERIIPRWTMVCGEEAPSPGRRLSERTRQDGQARDRASDSGRHRQSVQLREPRRHSRSQDGNNYPIIDAIP